LHSGGFWRGVTDPERWPSTCSGIEKVRGWMIAALALLIGCAKGHVIELWNNAGVDVVVAVDGFLH